MEALCRLHLIPPLSSTLLRPRRSSILFFPNSPIRAFSSSSSSSLFALPVTASSAFKGSRPRRNPVADWVSGNDAVARSIPIFTGGISLLAVLVNRAISGVSPVADASSSQSRADILALALAVTNLLTGLVWLSIQPKYISPVAPAGIQCNWVTSALPECAVLELLWAWESLSAATCCRSLVVVHGEDFLMQIGFAAESSVEDGGVVAVDVPWLTQGSLYRNVMKSGKQIYLANLSLYPGRSELHFLPSNTQVVVFLGVARLSRNAVILQPLGDKGILVIGGDTVRGFTHVDQAWVSSIAEKLDATLSKY
ncbi:hypothetical protein AXF42_Ash006231 [Apostasia shenzhenica]|uniref:Protein COFACTOR ASSEMBLY OF COMPLEX C SUBUNIT B CCB4, chloroplastic n=1 Tax=Apostasia shenzhenica TaxID=1088818 RepID=A0A2I0B0L9_9ASPA|nr:hypothetical protein AXF42_Ash006231 [Apostasia shenzhenica]